MEEKQLDLNAPLLSVRRHAAAAAAASASASTLRASGREGMSGPATVNNLSPPVYKTELKSGPVRDPGAVPFGWEQIPGRPKVASVLGSISPERPAPAPRLPPGKLAAKRENVKTAEREYSPAPARMLPPGKVVDSRTEIVRTVEDEGRQIGKVGRSPKDRTVRSMRPVGGVHDSLPDSAAKAYGSYGSKEEMEKLDGDDCDAFSDALETFSVAETSLFNGSVGGVSALDGQGWKRTGNSSDLQGRSFMMDRFLPAAKAMASEAPKYAPRRQLPASEPAKLVNRVHKDAQPLRSQPKPYFIQQYVLADEEENDESEEEDEEDDNAGDVVARACGVFPWSLKSSFCLANPIFHAQRMRNKKKTASTFVARKGNKPTKSNDSASSFSGSDEMTWEAVYRNKLVGRIQNLELHDRGSKLSESSSSLSIYEDTANNQLISCSDSQIQNGSSSYRHFHSPSGISPYRNGTSNSTFSERSGFLGLPKSIQSYGSDSSDTNPKGLEARKNTSCRRSKGTSGSLSPTVEKPLYADSACVGDASDPKSENMEAKELIHSVDKKATTPVEDQQKQGKPNLDSCVVITQQSALDASDVRKIGNVVNPRAVNGHSGLLTAIRLLPCADTSEDSITNHVAFVVNLTQGGDTLDKSSEVSMLPEQMPVGEHITGEQVSSMSEYSREQNSGSCLVADTEGNSSLLHSLPPLPSPKSPSESWLVRALPGSAKGSSSSLSFPHYRMKKSAAKTPEPKWETIIKSSNVDHAHLRYSEELSQTAARQTEN